jgi:hypothetical protein
MPDTLLEHPEIPHLSGQQSRPAAAPPERSGGGTNWRIEVRKKYVILIVGTSLLTWSTLLTAVLLAVEPLPAILQPVDSTP